MPRGFLYKKKIWTGKCLVWWALRWISQILLIFRKGCRKLSRYHQHALKKKEKKNLVLKYRNLSKFTKQILPYDARVAFKYFSGWQQHLDVHVKAEGFKCSTAYIRQEQNDMLDLNSLLHQVIKKWFKAFLIRSKHHLVWDRIRSVGISRKITFFFPSADLVCNRLEKRMTLILFGRTTTKCDGLLSYNRKEKSDVFSINCIQSAESMTLPDTSSKWRAAKHSTYLVTEEVTTCCRVGMSSTVTSGRHWNNDIEYIKKKHHMR